MPLANNIVTMTGDSPYFEQNKDTGKIEQVYSDEEFVNAAEQQPLASTKEIAEIVGCSQENAYRRLKALEGTDDVESKMAGNSLIWFPSK